MQTLKVREKKVSVHTYNYDNIIEFLNITKDILENPTVKQMKNFRQHYDCSCYEHCLEVAYWSYLFCKKYGWDYVSAARGAMLHDLFLYDWRGSKKKLHLKHFHAFLHPQIALYNAEKLFNAPSQSNPSDLPAPPKGGASSASARLALYLETVPLLQKSSPLGGAGERM